MKCIGVAIIIILNVFFIENRMIPLQYVTSSPHLKCPSSIGTSEIETIEDSNPNEKVLALKRYDNIESEEYFDYGKKPSSDNPKNPCAIVVLSNIQNPNMQSLLRKYRYDGNGVLIPDSVKYYVKLPQDMRSSPILVPLNDKAFSPIGGFVRYYKEVPPIPHAW